MKYIIIVPLILFLIPTIGKSQGELDRIINKDSVYIDSLEVVNKNFLMKFEKFYEKNKKLFDNKTYFVIDIMGYKDNDTNAFLLIISLGVDLENDLHWLIENTSGFFRFNDKLVLIPSINNRISVFQRVNKKQFYFNRKERITLEPATNAGYKVRITKRSKIQIRKLYYIKYPHSKVQGLYYKFRYGKHF